MKGLEEFIAESVEPSYIGSFEVEGDVNEDKIGSFRGKKHILNVYVWCNDPGYIPHFHVSDKDYNVDSCVMIEENRYFEHGSHISKLNTKQRKALNEFLKGDNETFSKYTNFEMVVGLWNSNNSKHKVNKNQKQPDYTTISNYK